MAKNTGKDIRIQRSGFWINPLYPELGCSPDGLVYNQDNKLIGVVEMKRPFVLAGKDPLCVDELNANQRNNLCYHVVNGMPCLKKTHKYYYQVQMQIALCEADFCDFVIWSSKGTIVERILPDVEFWKDLCSKLINFHHNTLMPEYLEIRIPRPQLILNLGFETLSMFVLGLISNLITIEKVG
ncbi:hypothetical protein ACJMK2_003860 [Sinanodonta woodiana]|uniref:YqaJ viral recombinase domain-containing protein n=1 Tax=Sinanodonta woodiana TaxID=1069815 RepID=A0ABD3XZG3_SINWO